MEVGVGNGAVIDTGTEVGAEAGTEAGAEADGKYLVTLILLKVRPHYTSTFSVNFCFSI